MTPDGRSLYPSDDLSVLFVEDSAIVRESTCDLLEEFFIRIDTAENGREGLQKFQARFEQHGACYDIVITDINMPVMNGIEMIDRMRKLAPELNVIVISAHNESEYLLDLINMGVSNFILKPIQIIPFQTVIDRIIETVRNKKKMVRMNAELHQMNLSLMEAKREAENASKMKSRFLANMSHEIRTPLNAITGFISLLKAQEDDPIKRHYLNVITKASESLLQIINDILDISLIESGKLRVDPVDFNPYDDLITVAELFQAKAAEKGVRFRIHYNRNMPDALFGDVLRINQILSNLLSNAVKFTPEGLSVKCVIYYKDGRLVIRVKDDGIGIVEEQQQEIFEAFSQVEGISRTYGGTGLGLSISAGLTQLLGGDLTLKSVPGKGSVFTLSVPVRKGRAVSREPEDASDVEKIDGHILMVEDNETNQMFFGIVMEQAGFTYDIANDGVEAVEKFKTGQYDLILMDENMPRLSGRDATRHILQIEQAESREHTPIISLTANAMEGDCERFIDAGMDGYIGKPVEAHILVKTIIAYLKACK